MCLNGYNKNFKLEFQPVSQKYSLTAERERERERERDKKGVQIDK